MTSIALPATKGTKINVKLYFLNMGQSFPSHQQWVEVILVAKINRTSFACDVIHVFAISRRMAAHKH